MANLFSAVTLILMMTTAPSFQNIAAQKLWSVCIEMGS